MATPQRFIVVACVAALLIAGCARAQPSGETVTPSASSSPMPTFQPSTAPATKNQNITLTGTVERRDIEGGCTVLRVDSTNKVYELVGGDPQVIKPEAHVTVVGRIRTDLMTTCQVGPVLEVISSQVA